MDSFVYLPPKADWDTCVNIYKENQNIQGTIVIFVFRILRITYLLEFGIHISDIFIPRPNSRNK